MDLSEVTLDMDELEAIRLADYGGLYHEEAAKRMHVSRATFGRIIGSARRKVAEALLEGKALKIAPCCLASAAEVEVNNIQTRGKE